MTKEKTQKQIADDFGNELFAFLDTDEVRAKEAARKLRIKNVLIDYAKYCLDIFSDKIKLCRAIENNSRMHSVALKYQNNDILHALREVIIGNMTLYGSGNQPYQDIIDNLIY